MSDVTLSSGREITIDLYKISMRDFRNLIDPEQSPEEGDELVGRISGLTADEVVDLPQPDYRRLVQAIFRKAREPLADPNLESAST